MLFVELSLIRWIGSNVIYLSYFSNFVLMGSFLGIGIGFLRAKSRVELFPWALLALAFLIGLVRILPVTIDRTGSQLIYFGGGFTGAPMWLVLPLVFLAVALVMAGIAQGVGRAFADFEPLEAYRIDILGSLCGIAAFTLLSFLDSPPVVWGAIAAALLLVLYAPALRALQVVAAVGIVVMLGRESLQTGASWSPYYKVFTFAAAPGVYGITVNGVPHQVIGSVAWHRAALPMYFIPYSRLRSHSLNNVLIVGAGSGSDVAIALAAGAKHVDAVEIDPRIYQIGRELNPDHPYRDPRVAMHIGDGRAFLRRSGDRYDLILFALPDSLALVSSNSNLRLESYLFTVEALSAARRLLTPNGVFGMYNFYREDWLVDRYASTVEAAFGHPPCIDTFGLGGTFTVMMVGREPHGVSCPSPWKPHGNNIAAPATDDHPFPYLRSPSIPPMYLLTLALILAFAYACIRTASGPLTQMTTYADLFFMGAAFLLLETKSVVEFALLFGSTWFVNALVFAAILIAVLAAIEVARAVRSLRPGPLYAALFVALFVAWLVEPARLLELGFAARFVAAGLLAFAPVFFANLVFAQRFRDVSSSTTAFGANLLGAMVGGVLEYASLLAGYRALLVVVALLYGLAFWLGRRQHTGEAHRVEELGATGRAETVSPA